MYWYGGTSIFVYTIPRVARQSNLIDVPTWLALKNFFCVRNVGQVTLLPKNKCKWKKLALDMIYNDIKKKKRSISSVKNL